MWSRNSGTNRLAGTLYGFFRTRSLDARNYFAPRDEDAPAYNRAQFGGSLGRADRAQPHVLFRRLRTNAPARRRDAHYERTDTAGTPGGFLTEPFSPAHRSDQRVAGPFQATEFRTRSSIPLAGPLPRSILEPNRSTPLANYVSSPTLRDDIDHFDVQDRSLRW